MRRLVMTTLVILGTAGVVACGDGSGGGDDPTSSEAMATSTSTASPSSPPGELTTETPGQDGTWAGKLGPIDMPPGPYAPAPVELPTTVKGWHASRGARATSATYLPDEEKGDAPGVAVELHHDGQPSLTGSNAATVDGKVYCEPASGDPKRWTCAVPFDGGYLTLTPGHGLTKQQAVDLGKALYRSAEQTR